jgi:hypothetical protein
VLHQVAEVAGDDDLGPAGGLLPAFRLLGQREREEAEDDVERLAQRLGVLEADEFLRRVPDQVAQLFPP